MASLDDYTDEELGRLFRQAGKDAGYYREEQITTRTAFATFLRMIGLGVIADAIIMSKWAWQKVKGIWRSMFG